MSSRSPNRDGSAERITMALFLSIVICFFAIVYMGHSVPNTFTIIGVPDGKASAYAAVQQQASSRGLDREVFTKDHVLRVVPESGLSEDGNPK